MEELTKDGYRYIIGARPKNETDGIKEQILAMQMNSQQSRLMKKP